MKESLDKEAIERRNDEEMLNEEWTQWIKEGKS